MPSVSVVIPTYHHRDYILQTLQSVFDQTFKDFEIIVVNDGSPDDTSDLLRPFAGDGRLVLIEQANAGQAAARNRGISSATGEFIALLDDDDFWPSDHLEWQVSALRQLDDAVMVYGTHKNSDQSAPDPVDCGTPAVQGFDYFARGCPLVSPGQALFRGRTLKRIGGLDQSLWGTDDWDLYLRLAKEGDILFEERLALTYRVHERNASRDFWRMFKNGSRVVDKHFPAGRSDRRARAAAKRSIRHVTAQLGIREVLALRRAGRRWAMLKPLIEVIWIKPSLLLPGGLLRRSRHVLTTRR
jgi:glycosyltransferase involved in cell wall biosynthesis